MTRTQRTPPNAAHPAAVSGEQPTCPVNPFLEVQRAQWEAFLSWQQSLATFNRDLWEQWAVRYAGGLPIDG
jgi:predicted Abi (CAAX) family protease